MQTTISLLGDPQCHLRQSIGSLSTLIFMLAHACISLPQGPTFSPFQSQVGCTYATHGTECIFTHEESKKREY